MKSADLFCWGVPSDGIQPQASSFEIRRFRGGNVGETQVLREAARTEAGGGRGQQAGDSCPLLAAELLALIAPPALVPFAP